MSVIYDGLVYYYVTNLQGDVTAILNYFGVPVVEYTYDAWGNILSITGSMASTLGQFNPLRYRGYVYDSETGFYYLQSRYYDPNIGRFINADAVIADADGSIQGYNMFAYCFNNPVSMSDSSGNWPKWFNVVTAVVVAAVAVVAVTVYVIENMPSKEEHYSRNSYQEDVLSLTPSEIISSEDWEKQPDSKNAYHRHTVGEQGEDAKDNVKYMTKDGKKEVVINFSDVSNPKIVTDPFNVGTYNFGTKWYSHFVKDMLPYYIWGNSEVDSGLRHLPRRIIGVW